MYKQFTLIVASLILISCGGSNVQVFQHEQRDATIYRLFNIQIKQDKQESERLPDQVSFEVVKEISNTTGDTLLYLGIMAYAEEGLEIRVRDTLELVIDAETHYLKCARLEDTKTLISQGTDLFGRGYKIYLERPVFDVDIYFLRKLAGAKTVRFDIYGRNRHCTGKFLPSGLRRIGGFCDKYLI